MAQEIERKFLVKGDFKADSFKATRITQGYLSSVPERTVRVRVKGEKGIPVDEVKELLKLCEPGIIDKTRYLVKAGEHTFEVDEFYGENEGLVMAEVELKDENENFIKPAWLGEEVTGDVKYYNSMLMKHPYTKW